jgi:hypothetical protein
MAARVQDIAFFDSAFIKDNHPTIKNAITVILPPRKTSQKRIVYISKELADKIPDGRLHPEITDASVLKERLRKAFIRYLPDFDNRGPIRTHNFRVSRATELMQKGV